MGTQPAQATPAIGLFAANPATITAGGGTKLLMVFGGGKGQIYPGGLAAISGIPVAVSPTATTVFTLTVTQGDGPSMSQTATVTVLPAGSAVVSPDGVQAPGSQQTAKGSALVNTPILGEAFPATLATSPTQTFQNRGDFLPPVPDPPPTR